jgi:transposase
MVVAAHALSGFTAGKRGARDFARATGRLAKTDRLDAAAIARFAEAAGPPVRPLEDAAGLALKALVARRRERVALRVAETNRLGATGVERVRQSLLAVIETLDRQIAALTVTSTGRSGAARPGARQSFTVEARWISSIEAANAASKAPSLMECLRPSARAREKLAITPRLAARRRQASSRA